MEFYLTDTGETKEIIVRPWSSSGYGPDCFNDLETATPELCEKNEDGAYICTSEYYEELKEWWEEEVLAMRNGQQGHDLDYSGCAQEIYLFTEFIEVRL